MKIALEQINETDLDEICQKFIMSEKARLLYKVHYDRHLFLLALIESKCFSDAILFIIHSLPQKKAIQWACHSALNFHEEPLSFDDLVALNAVESWLLDSSDINHQNTQILKPVDTPSSSTWVSMAAFWTGNVENKNVISYSPVLDAVYASIMLSVFQIKIDGQEGVYLEAIHEGMGLLDGRVRV